MGDLGNNKGGGCCPPMDLMRSEPMQLVQLTIPMESAHLSFSYLGDLSLLQFKDLNAEKNPFQRTYATQVVKNVFVIFYSGERAKTKIRKICEAFGVNCYPFTEDIGKKMQMINEVSGKISELKTTIDIGLVYRDNLLKNISYQFEQWNNLGTAAKFFMCGERSLSTTL